MQQSWRTRTATFGQFDKSEPLYLRCLKIQEARFGSDHPDVAFALNSLGLLYAELNRFDEAEPLLLRCLKIRESQASAPIMPTSHDHELPGRAVRRYRQYSKAEPLLHAQSTHQAGGAGP